MEWVAEFLASYPRVRVEFVLSDTMADFIEDGIDVAFRGSVTLPDSSLIARRLCPSSLVLAASPAYLTARGTPYKLADLAAHDCLVSVPVGEATTWRLKDNTGSALITVTGRFSANTGQAQKLAAISGLGICLLPFNMLRDKLLSGELVEVLPGVASTVGNLYVVYPSRRYVPHAVAVFVDMVEKRLVDILSTP
jgi:DNA-binding transcriptional LysR family regulator